MYTLYITYVHFESHYLPHPLPRLVGGIFAASPNCPLSSAVLLREEL